MIIDRAVVEQALEVLETGDMAWAVMNVEGVKQNLRAALAREDEPMRRAIQDAVTAGLGIMRGDERIDLASIYKWDDPKTLPCLTPDVCQKCRRGHCRSPKALSA